MDAEEQHDFIKHSKTYYKHLIFHFLDQGAIANLNLTIFYDLIATNGVMKNINFFEKKRQPT